MKVSTKIILGYGILIVLMVGLVAYHIYTIRRMESINNELTTINFQAGLLSLDLASSAGYVGDNTKKYFFGADAEYLERLREWQASFAARLLKAGDYVHSEVAKREFGRLNQLWEAYLAEFDAECKKGLPKASEEDFPTMGEILQQLPIRSRALLDQIRISIQEEVARSREIGRNAARFTKVVAALALLLSCVVSYFIVRSISVPLAHLTEGTRHIADGHFYYRLETSRNDEFAALAKDFNAMAIHLNELDEMKKDFVSHVSHELKAPLASIQEAIQLMLEGLPGPLTDKQRRLLELNLQSSRRLSDMIGKLLDLSRMEAGVMEYELKNNDLSELVRTVASEYEAKAAEKKHRVTLVLPEDSPSVHCDGDRIIQVLGNLLGNAIKFTPGGGLIEVRAQRESQLPESLPKAWRNTFSSTLPENGFLVVTVADSGPGVPDAHKAKIFEKFQQANSGKRKPGQGAGLGLAICRTIVQAHRGAIWVEDNPGGGSMFRFLLRAGEGTQPVTRRESLPI